MLYYVLCSEIMIEIMTAIDDFDYNEDRGENKGKNRNDVAVPPISSFTPNHHAKPIAISILSSAHIHLQQLQLYQPT